MSPIQRPEQLERHPPTLDPDVADHIEAATAIEPTQELAAESVFLRRGLRAMAQQAFAGLNAKEQDILRRRFGCTG